MQKPIVVCGMDFSGTSMVAGMLHAAGIDMGDVESAEDVVQSDRPIRYRMFEDRAFQKDFGRYAEDIMYSPYEAHWEAEDMYHDFLQYMAYREASAHGKLWGVKSNVLTFLTLHPRWKELPVEWLTTYRPLEDCMASAFRKLGHLPGVAAFLGVQHLAHNKLIDDNAYVRVFPFQDFMAGHKIDMAIYLNRFQIDADKIRESLKMIDPIHKGVVPWQPHGSPSPV